MILRHRFGYAAFALIPLALALAACSKSTPEAQVRSVIAAAADAAERNDARALRAHIAQNYTDTQGNDKRAVEALVTGYLLSHRSLHVYSRVAHVAFPMPQRAHAEVYVAMAAERMVSAEDLPRLRANLYRFDLTFAREGNEWRVVGAAWRPAEVADFL